MKGAFDKSLQVVLFLVIILTTILIAAHAAERGSPEWADSLIAEAQATPLQPDTIVIEITQWSTSDFRRDSVWVDTVRYFRRLGDGWVTEDGFWGRGRYHLREVTGGK